MSELKERIQKIKDEMGWTGTQMARVSGVSSPAVGQWLGKGNKVIHSIADVAVAINLERATGYSALWIAQGIGPEKLEARHAQEFWPFELISRKKIDELNKEERIRLESAMLIAAAQVGLDVRD